MTLPRVSYEARCPDCGRRAVVPSHQVGHGSETWTFACCTGLVTAPIEKVEKERKTLQRGGGLRRRKKPRERSPLERELMETWAEQSRRLPCARCGVTTDWAAGIIVEGHHIVRQRLIEAKAKAERWAAEKLARLLWDTRNRLPLCGTCHGQHHRPAKEGHRLSWALVKEKAPKIETFGGEVGLLREARREYA